MRSNDSAHDDVSRMFSSLEEEILSRRLCICTSCVISQKIIQVPAFLTPKYKTMIYVEKIEVEGSYKYTFNVQYSISIKLLNNLALESPLTHNRQNIR